MRPSRTPFDDIDKIIREMFQNMNRSPKQARDGIMGSHSVGITVDQNINEEKQFLEVIIDTNDISVEKDELDVVIKPGPKGQQWMMISFDKESGEIFSSRKTQFPLKTYVDAELADTQFKNGVLTVKLPIVDSFENGVQLDI